MLNNVYLFETNSNELYISAVNRKEALIYGRQFQPCGKLFIRRLYDITTSQKGGLMFKKYIDMPTKRYLRKEKKRRIKNERSKK